MKNKSDNKYDYDILFIGGVYEKNKEEEYLKKSKNGIQNAINTHQWSFIKGLDANNKNPVKILSARYVEPYPLYKDIFIKKNNWSHTKGAIDENIGFLNIKIVKNIERKLKLRCKAVKWGKLKTKRAKIIICYYPGIPQMEATIKAKTKNKKIITILIIPDIPKFMNLKSEHSKLQEKISGKIERKQEQLISKFDGYILLTDEMARILKIENKNKIVIEGIVQPEDMKIYNKNPQKGDRKEIVYSGSLHKKYGIKEYIEAIKLIEDKNIIFYIFGSGEMKDAILELARTDNRIKFMGYKAREEVLKYQRNATLLINPRSTEEEFVKYSFPSKILEYMLSGTPVLTTRLPCIPKEYEPFLFFINGNSNAENIKNAINNTINLKQEILNQKGKEAQEFILKNKNYLVQTDKIQKLIKELEEGRKNE